ncbi:MAG: UPF0182 family protein [Acidimicrobiales bacterium]
MRASSDLPRRPGRVRRRGTRRPNRGRIILISIAVVIVVLFLSARFLAGFFTDYLWFDSLGYSGVFTGVLGAKVKLALIFSTLFFALLFTNLFVADKLAPTYRPPGPEEEFLARYRQLVGPRAMLVRVAVSVVFAFIAGVGVSGQWKQWILFTHARSFGTKDPLFHTDVSFYVFRLPFLNFVVSWLFASLVIVIVITAVAHYLNGGIRLQVQTNRVTPQVKVHLSLLLGGLALLKAAGYWLQRYQLLFSSRGAVDGATYTDVKAQLPAIYLLVAISLTAFVLLLINVRRRGWVLPALAVGLWALIALVAGALYPAFIQRFRVQPAESTKELPYIDRNISATRQAFGLDNVVTTPYPVDAATLTKNDLETAAPTLSNVRLLDPDRVINTFRIKQRLKGYYTFNQLDIDRYPINGSATPVAIAARELQDSAVPQQSWEGRHLAYTHGSGIAFAPTDKVGPDGAPVFVDQSSPKAPPQLTKTGVYFGEDLGGYAVVKTKRKEVSLAASGTEVQTEYSGKGGVSMSSVVRRVAFALRFGEPNLLLSNNITASSQILYVRDVRARVAQLAPFLTFDSDPYPVVVSGRLVWVVDAYTTTDNFPYSQSANTDDLPNASGLKGKDFNYARNSVKAVVDAYDGTTTFYVIDSKDPLIQAYEAAFPKLFTANDKVPKELRAHFRYPSDLFRVQTTAWGRYHITDPGLFYQRDNAWNVAQDPGFTQQGAQVTTATSTNSSGVIVQTTSKRKIDPYYALLQLPGDKTQSFVTLREFVPFSEKGDVQLLVSFMTVSSDPDTYGDLRVFQIQVPDSDQLPAGPLNVQSSTQSDADISRELSLLDTTGSTVEFGTLQLLPIGRSILYVRPLYTIPKNQSDLPVLKKVIVTFQNRSYMDNTFEAALTKAFGSSPDLGTVVGGATVPPPTGPTTPPPTTDTIASLLDQANTLYAEANVALRSGDLATYQKKVDQAFNAVKQAQALASPTTTTTAPANSSTTSSSSTSSTTVNA